LNFGSLQRGIRHVVDQTDHDRGALKPKGHLSVILDRRAGWGLNV
jgi:hypothetical protein